MRVTANTQRPRGTQDKPVGAWEVIASLLSAAAAGLRSAGA